MDAKWSQWLHENYDFKIVCHHFLLGLVPLPNIMGTYWLKWNGQNLHQGWPLTNFHLDALFPLNVRCMERGRLHNLKWNKRVFMNVGDILKLCFVKSFFLDVHVIIKFLFQNINFFKGFCLWLELNLMWTWFQPLMTLGGLLSRYGFGVCIFTSWNLKNIKWIRTMVDIKKNSLYFVFGTLIPIVASEYIL